MSSQAAQLFKVLSVEARVEIVRLLKTRGSLGTEAIAETLEITPAAVSQHLQVLKQAGLVRSTRHGYRIPYSLDHDTLERCRCVFNEVCSCGCAPAAKCHGADSPRLKLLLKYEQDLEEELGVVRSRIADMRTRKE